jgi:hypothetical protein
VRVPFRRPLRRYGHFGLPLLRAELQKGCDGQIADPALEWGRDAVVGLLGPLEVLSDGREVRIVGVKERVVLALLALASPRAVSAKRQVEELWAGQVPDSGLGPYECSYPGCERHWPTREW